MAGAETAGETWQQTLEQRRAAYAWGCISAQETRRVGRDYRGLVRGVPAMVMTNGLGQTLAFLRAKAQDAPAASLLHRHLDGWLRHEHAPLRWTDVQGRSFQDGQDVLGRIQRSGSLIYRQAAQEALAILVWLKRFAEAELGSAAAGGSATASEPAPAGQAGEAL